MSATERIIVLVDMDCFYCQVEQKLNPSLIGKPLAVVQYNAWKGGGLIAVNYEARAKGVTRHMRGDEAKAKCPEIELAKVPSVRDKADLTRYRDAGKQVAEVLQTFTALLERASVDEAYLDITEAVEKRLEMAIKPEQLKNSHIVGFSCVTEYLREIESDACLNDSDVKLAIGGVITEEIRATVFEKTGYRCSAGVAHNKVLAKLSCGLHKPNQQTILPHESISTLYKTLPIKKIRSLGGKFGDEVMQKLKVNNVIDLIKFTEKELQQHFEEKIANWLYNIARGINHEPVVVRLVSKSIGCCKQFRGRAALRTEKSVRHWTHELAVEITERIEKDVVENNRKPRILTVSYSQQVGNNDVSSTRSQALNTIEQEKIYQVAYEVIKKNCQHTDGSFRIKFLSLNVGKFESIKNVVNITSYFKNVTRKSNECVTSPSSTRLTEEVVNNELGQLSREIHAVVQANIELSRSLDPTNFANNDYNKESTLEATENTDDSEAELEAINSSVCEAQTEMTTKNSFFRNFLSPLEVPKRDFNTSAILNEVKDVEITNNETIDSPVASDSNENRNISETEHTQTVLSMLSNSDISQFHNNNLPTTSRKSFITDDNKELCIECNKLIPVENIISHMDYHFAIKMVRDEAHLYKPQKINNKAPNNDKNKVELVEGHNMVETLKKHRSVAKIKNAKVSNNTPNRKRKGSNLDHADIMNFFNKAQDGPVAKESSGVCPDCNKRIKLDDMANHTDYHVARKLHQELNSLNVVVNSARNKNAVNWDGTATKMINVDKNQTITTYFKKV